MGRRFPKNPGHDGSACLVYPCRGADSRPEKEKELAMPRLAVLFLAPVACAAVVAAPAPFPKPGRPISDELKEMQGSYELIRWQRYTRDNNWVRKTSRAVGGGAARIEADRLIISSRGGDRERWRLRVGGNGNIDLVVSARGQEMRGIYELEGDTLTICYSEPCQRRPGRLGGFGPWMLVLKRKAP
jgi:uncharacterized protein (TIGR03067 family)